MTDKRDDLEGYTPMFRELIKATPRFGADGRDISMHTRINMALYQWLINTGVVKPERKLRAV